MLEELALVLVGILLGAAAGLVPGIHPNVFATAALVFAYDPLGLSLVIVSAAVANSFVSFIPAVFLGAPEGGSELSVLPGHRLLLQGRGYEAVRLTVVGGITAVALALVTLPAAAVVMPRLYEAMRPHIHWILAFVLIYAFYKDRSLWPPVVVALSGAMGMLALDNFKDPLFPMLTGLFGVSGLLYSLKAKTVVPKQTKIFEPHRHAKGCVIGYLGGMLVGLLPGLGSSQAAFVLQQASRKTDEREFLVAVGGISTADVIFSLLALWLIGNPRSGVAVSVGQLIGDVTVAHVIAFVGVVCVSGGLAALLTLKLAVVMSDRFTSVNYGKLTKAVLVGLAVAVVALTGLPGLFLMSVAACIGTVAIASGTRRAYCMGCLMVPTMLFFAGL